MAAFYAGLCNLEDTHPLRKTGRNRSKSAVSMTALGPKSDSDRQNEFFVGKVNRRPYSRVTFVRMQQVAEERGTDEMWADFKTLRRGVA